MEVLIFLGRLAAAAVRFVEARSPPTREIVQLVELTLHGVLVDSHFVRGKEVSVSRVESGSGDLGEMVVVRIARSSTWSVECSFLER